MRLSLLLLAALLLPSPVFAQSAAPLPSVAELQGQTPAGKQTLIARALALTPAEEADFWPVYDATQAALADIATRRREARAALAAGDDADDAVEALVEADLDFAETLEQAWSRLRGRLPAGKLARYLDIERRAAAAAAP
jgi:Spy/CpxP family protein refolding chaperone